MELRGEKGQEESQDSATDPESRMLGRLGTQQEAEETGQRGCGGPARKPQSAVARRPRDVGTGQRSQKLPTDSQRHCGVSTACGRS